MADRIHLTTAIFYSNGTPHVGSAYEALAADVFARCQRRRRGRENVSFLSGTDEHGDKIRRAAIAEGLAPKAYTDKMSVLFRDAFDGLNVDLDYWVRTTDAVHEKFVQQMLARTTRQGQHRVQGIRRPLLRRLRALLHRKGTAAAGQRVPDPQHSGRIDQGEAIISSRSISSAQK